MASDAPPVSALGVAAQALLDQGQSAKAARVALAALDADATDRFALGFLGRLSEQDGGLLATTLDRLSAADPRAAALDQDRDGDAATRAQRATWRLDLGQPHAALRLTEGEAPALRLARARCLRALGDLAGAALLYAERTDEPEALRLASCLAMEPPSLPAAASGLAAVPFWRFRHPLPDDLHEGLRHAALARLPEFRPAKVYPLPDQPSEQRPESRQALRLEAPLVETAPLAGWLRTRRETLLRSLLGQVPAMAHLELQVTLSGEGAFYKAHRDSGDRTTGLRLLTVILYLHGQPRGFQGGGLRLYDSDLTTGHWLGGGYTLIPPDDATLLVFPAAATHEVRRVTDCARPEEGRLTVNGWFHRTPGAG